MARAIPADRLTRLIDVATETFIAQGYRQTQMADVASLLRVAKGTLYGYVRSKEALFDLAVRFADGHAPTPEPGMLPLPSPEPGATVAYVRERLAAEASQLTLVAVLAGKVRIKDPGDELSEIVRDLFRRIARHRRALKLVDRCARDYPDLARVWFAEGRWAQHELLVRYLTRRIDAGRLRRVPDTALVARTLLESLAFWAMHRHWDPSPQDVDDDAAQDCLVEFFSRGLLKASK